MHRHIFDEDHDAFRRLIRDFIAVEVVPHFRQWESAGQVPRDLYRRLGDIGVMGISLPEKFGGAGRSDYRYNAIIQEEAAAAHVTLGTLRTHLDIVVPYFRPRIRRALLRDRHDRARHRVRLGRRADGRGP
jgi:acyl-CoA dehydrogenase